MHPIIAQHIAGSVVPSSEGRELLIPRSSKNRRCSRLGLGVNDQTLASPGGQNVSLAVLSRAKPYPGLPPDSSAMDRDRPSNLAPIMANELSCKVFRHQVSVQLAGQPSATL